MVANYVYFEAEDEMTKCLDQIYRVEQGDRVKEERVIMEGEYCSLLLSLKLLLIFIVANVILVFINTIVTHRITISDVFSDQY